MKRWPYIIFILLPALIFLQFPLNDSLPGNTSSWLAISFSNFYIEKFIELIGLRPMTSFLYPDQNILSFGQGGVFLATVFTFFKIITRNDIWSYYFFIIFIFSSNLSTLYYCYFKISKKVFPSILAALFFGIHTFLLANIDDPHEVFFPLIILSLYHLYRYRESSDYSDLKKSLFLFAFQVYFSIYHFIFLGLCFLFFLPKKAYFEFKTILLSALIVSPFLLNYFYSYFTQNYINPFITENVIKDCSLSFKDFFSALDGQLLLGGRTWSAEEYPIFWAFIRKHAYIGFTLFAFALPQIISFKKNIKLILLLFLFLIISLGPEVNGLKMPLYYLYEIHDFFLFFRIPLRAFIFVLLILSFASFFTLQEFLKDKSKKMLLYVTLSIFTLHCLEHIPRSLPSFRAGNYIQAPKKLIEYFKDKRNEILIHLPTGLGTNFLNSQNPLYDYSRQVIYMNWKTQHHQNLIGGVHAYWPRKRMDQQKLIELIPQKKALDKLGATYISFHKKMVIAPEEKAILGQLKSHLEIVIDHPDFILFKVFSNK